MDASHIASHGDDRPDVRAAQIILQSHPQGIYVKFLPSGQPITHGTEMHGNTGPAPSLTAREVAERGEEAVDGLRDLLIRTTLQ